LPFGLVNCERDEKFLLLEGLLSYNYLEPHSVGFLRRVKMEQRNKIARLSGLVILILFVGFFLLSCGSYHNLELEQILSYKTVLYNHEPNDISRDADPFDVQNEQSQEHAIYPEGDADWVSFSAREDSFYVIETFSSAGYGMNGPDDVDTYIYIYDTDGVTVISEDDDGGGAKGFSKLAFQPPEDGTYYIKIVDYNTAHGYTPGETGSYIIMIKYNESIILYPDGLWHETEYRYHDEDGISWYYGQEDIWNYDTIGFPNSGVLMTDEMTLSPDTVLSFWYWLDTEYPIGMAHDTFDFSYVQISTDEGGSWTTLLNLGDTVNFPAEDIWEFASVDLSSYAGQDVLIRFYFDTIDNGGNMFEGWYVDEIELY
jgi:hypothetical protein